jgi:PAS domain S-box-containing protein
MVQGMENAARDSGIDVIGRVPWGTHFSLFYQTKQDLIDVLVPYFKSGLKNNELCIWVTAEPLNAGEVKAYMAEAMPDFYAYFEKGQIEIIPYTEWYTINGGFDPDRVLVGWIEKLRKAREQGFRGLRATGDMSWLETGGWKDFLDYEQTVNDILGRHEMIALCTYPLYGCDANDILEVVSAHQFALIRRNGEWKIIEDQGQKKARKALRESEEVLWHIFGSSPVPMVLYNESKGSYHFNNKFTETFGYTIEDIPDINEWWLLAYPDEKYREFVKKRWYAAVDEAVEKRTSIEPQEAVVTCKDGSKKHIFGYFSSIGVLNLVVFYDITERKRAEEELDFERSQLLSIFDSIDDVVYVTDPYTYEVLYANKAMKEKFSGDLVGGVCYREFQRKDSPCDFCTNSIILKEKGKPFRWEFYNPTVGRYFLITDRIIKWPDGRDVRFEIAKDITERKRAEEELANAKDQLDSELDAMDRLHAISVRYVLNGDLSAVLDEIIDAAVSITKADMGNIQILDPESGRLKIMAQHGFERQFLDYFNSVAEGRAACGTAMMRGERVVVEDVPRSPIFVDTPEDLEVMLAAGVRAVQSTPLLSRSGRLLGMFSTHYRTSRRPDDRGLKLIDLLVRQTADIIERTQAEKLLVDSKAQAELYLDLMGHDINNMHQIALGYLELARDMHPEAGESELLDKPIEVLQRSARLIRNVRKLQSLKEGVFQTQVVDVCQLLVDVQREFGTVPHKAVTLNLGGCEQCYVHANELLHDVFVNLVGNAIKHTGDHADIAVDLDIVWNDGRQYCRVMVEDDGPGIIDDFKERVFNRLPKGTDKAKGMGLGLYLVKSLVESYGGKVWVEDRVSGDHTKGARFVVTLPAMELKLF